MRSRDWSSDVCSSDLRAGNHSVGWRNTVAKLLQLSGIGPAALLSSLGIEVVADAPDVGRNLLEHRYLSTHYRVRGESLNRSEERRVGKGCVRPCRSRWSPYT